MKGPVSLNLRANEDASSRNVVASASNICLNSSCNYVGTILIVENKPRVSSHEYLRPRNLRFPTRRVSSLFRVFVAPREINFPNYPKNPAQAVQNSAKIDNGVNRRGVLRPSLKRVDAAVLTRFLFFHRKLSSNFPLRRGNIVPSSRAK